MGSFRTEGTDGIPASAAAAHGGAVRRTVALLAAMLLLCGATQERAAGYPAELLEMSVQELMNLDISSVSKKEQKVSDAAAAVFVITQEDIRRSGATSIPELLRMVPGLDVARIDASKWAISSRGFNAQFANKLLVLMDGRTLYTPIFSGVHWDVQDTVLEDIERIEVIRGPGATLWGANAVNGVINIITKSSQATQGGLITTGYGTEERGFGAVRYGGKLGEGAAFRIYARYFNRDGGEFPSGEEGADGWELFRSGFRMDWSSSSRDTLTLQGDVYDGDEGTTWKRSSLLPPFAFTTDVATDMRGANLLSRWRHTVSESSDWTLQIYYDRNEREDVIFGEQTEVFDIDFQHRFGLGGRQEIVWGVGYRLDRDELENTFEMAFDPASRDSNLFSAFVQDEITLVRERLRLTVGSKFEHNDFTGFELQPNLRLLWTPHTRHSLWASVSRAVRTPSRLEADGLLHIAALPPVTLLTVFGNPELESEELVAYELGYRAQLKKELAWDVALFFNDYSRLRAGRWGAVFPEQSPPPPHLVLPLYSNNDMKGTSWGVETAVDWRPLEWWRLQAAYTFLTLELEVLGEKTDRLSEVFEGTNPQHQFSLRSFVDIGRNVEFDLWLRLVDDLPDLAVPGYVTLDARLAWRPWKNFEIAVVGRNLFDRQHLEFRSEFNSNTVATEVERSVYGKVTWCF